MSVLVLLAVLERAPGEATGLEGLAFVRAGELWIAVERRAEAPTITAEALREQDARVRALAAVTPALLPFRFGTVVADEAAIPELLRPGEAALVEALGLVRGREQMTLRLFGATDAAVEAAEPAAPGPEADTSHAGPGTRYLAARLRARGREIPGLTAIQRAVEKLVFAERIERAETPGLLGTVYHLVARGEADVYRRAVESVPFPGKVRVSGPFPPYAFAPGIVA